MKLRTRRRTNHSPLSKMSLGLKTVEDNGKLCDLGNVGGETAAMDACKIVSALIYECNTIHK